MDRVSKARVRFFHIGLALDALDGRMGRWVDGIGDVSDYERTLVDGARKSKRREEKEEDGTEEGMG